jgi:hypothetical protein
MSRPRTIDQDDVLIAAEVVANRDGAANLTLDAVANEVGIRSRDQQGQRDL